MRLRSTVGPWVLTLATLAGFSGAAQAQSTRKAGGEFRINVQTTGNQRLPAAAQDPSGNVFVVWQGDGQDGSGSAIIGKVVNAVGQTIGSEFQVNQVTAGDQGQPAVAVDGAGRFTVVWSGPDGNGTGIFARQFSASSPPGAEFAVNTYTTGDQAAPRVSSGPGGVGVVWESPGQDGAGQGVFGRIFTSAGTPATGEFVLSQTTAADQASPAVVALDSGAFAVAWRQPAGAEPHVFSRTFAANGSPLRGETQISVLIGFGAARREHIGLAAVPGGGGAFAASWWEGSFFCGKFGCRPSDRGTQVRAHAADGTPLTGPSSTGGGPGSTGRWQGAMGMNLSAMPLVAYTSNPSVLPCVVIPPAPPPDPCATLPEDGSQSGVFAVALRPTGLSPRVPLNTFTFGEQSRPAVAGDPFGNTLVFWQSASQDGDGEGIYAQRLGGLFPAGLTVDPAGNGVIDPGQVEEVRPSWTNRNGQPATFDGSAYAFVGPAGGTYSLTDPSGSYGTVDDGAAGSCLPGCYGVNVTVATPRPAAHMDAHLGEVLTPDEWSLWKPWLLHVGGSFADVPASSGFYRFVETLLHNGVTGGCAATLYCPTLATNRAQMAVFVLVARHGPSYAPPACTTPMFADVPATSPFCRWIEELARRGVVAGCGGGNYCPDDPVSREQMAVFTLRTLDPGLDPPACTTPMFADVPASSVFCRWIEELARRQVVAGCGGGNYCPQAPVTREQMAVFLAATFGLRLY